ncbi:MAG: Gfo/Idh/MocA family protein [Longimicrobiales bacterium]
MNRIGVAVIGCGTLGTRRARTAATDMRTALRVVVDSNRERAAALAAELHVDSAGDWREALARTDVGCVVVCTPIALLIPIGIAALRSGRHVLIEKPLGRNATEARAIATEARRAGTVLKVGFNSRYRPAVARARELCRQGVIGRLMQLSARSGDGGRPDVETAWRADAELAGGGELLGAGVDIVDLFQWFAGPAIRAQAELQCALWNLGRLEDNAFGLLRFGAGIVGQFHVSMTQWRKQFSFEANGDLGTLTLQSGHPDTTEILTLVRRGAPGIVPVVETVPVESSQSSWVAEWSDFTAAMHGAGLRHGLPDEGLQIMATVDALYAAARSGSAVAIAPLAPDVPAQ